jgi:hypothetical protein
MKSTSMTIDESKNDADVKRSGAVRLLFGLAAGGMVWLIVLPRMASTDGVRQHLRFLKERRIEAGAMYYTDLEAMTPILRRLHGRPADEDRQQDHERVTTP